MESFSSFHLRRWIEDNRHLYDPPFKTNRVVVHEKDLIVMVLHGPNERLDFHLEPADEFFYQIEGELELHLKPEGARRRVIKIAPGEIFVPVASLTRPGGWRAHGGSLSSEKENRKKTKSSSGSAKNATRNFCAG
ncbi:MAG: hypothetical protein HY695_24260 [Deltaproteobacteria bacterium]|nr:hypothetical protein [Deltaproteobacteria bacterium]